MPWFVFLLFLVLGILSLYGVRWAYALYLAVGLLYFPARVGFTFSPRPCELTIDIPIALASLANYEHIVLFALLFMMSRAQLGIDKPSAIAAAAFATMAMGVVVEIAEGITGGGFCRVRDLVPDAAGVVLGMVIVSIWNKAFIVRRMAPRQRSE